MRKTCSWDHIYEDEDFVELFEVQGRPDIAPWRLALVTVSP
jgi:hypothetical protein